MERTISHDATIATEISRRITMTAITPRFTHDATEIRAFESLARDLRVQADDVDALADKCETWGQTTPRSPRAALGLIETATRLQYRGETILANKLIGPNTHSSHANELHIALGNTLSSSRGMMGYAIAYALGQDEQYGPELTTIGSSLVGRLDTKASSLRVYAASCRVVAGIADQVARGEYARIG